MDRKKLTQNVAIDAELSRQNTEEAVQTARTTYVLVEGMLFVIALLHVEKMKMTHR